MARCINTEECTPIYAKHVLLYSVGVGGWFYLFIFNDRGTDCSLHKVLKCEERQSLCDPHSRFQEACVNAVRASEGALYRL